MSQPIGPKASASAVADISAHPPAIMDVVGMLPGRSGVVELQLSCGHAIRRRLSFCPPKRLLCPICKSASAAGKANG